MDIKKSQISVQTFFMILMGICFVWILIFGYKQITSINDQISEQDRVLITNDIKKALEYCSDPLNKGTSKSIKLDYKQFNGICLVGDNNFNTLKYGPLGNNLNKFKSENIIENVYLIKANVKFNESSNEYDFSEPNIIDSFYADFGKLSDSVCIFETLEFEC